MNIPIEEVFSREQLELLHGRSVGKAKRRAELEYPPGAKREKREAELTAMYFNQYVGRDDGRG
ncbi:hypothetical protein [Xanthomonas sacchari]|uniref:hypothetical protein n=1 Tax=Xanthomonas sacchari TaxID=56458 RepID=UPI0022595CE6|nr:hypothetical protein [Xanthomonas sacchari]MCW0370230.1 hypothetical protein [Xanthomonas sacchari]